MKEIFQRKLFWVILVILLLAVFIYPPWIKTSKISIWRDWDWSFSNTSWGLSEGVFTVKSIELDFKMILAESIIAILSAIGVCIIPFGKGRKKND